MKIWDWIGHIGEDRQARVQGGEREGGRREKSALVLSSVFTKSEHDERRRERKGETNVNQSINRLH